MAAETSLANVATGSATGTAHNGLWVGTVKPFVVAHPIGMAVIGGVLVGMGTYYLMKKFSKKTEEPSPA